LSLTQASADWDAEQARALRRNQLAQIEKSNRDDGELAEAGLVLLRQYMPKSAAALGNSPHAWSEWAKTLTKIKRDALGMAEPGRATTAAGEPESHGGVDTEVRDVMPFLSDLQRMQLHDIAIDSVRIRCEQRARAAHNFPVDVLADSDPPAVSSDPSSGDDEVIPRSSQVIEHSGTLRPSGGSGRAPPGCLTLPNPKLHLLRCNSRGARRGGPSRSGGSQLRQRMALRGGVTGNSC
jgi:hypothetical protein